VCVWIGGGPRRRTVVLPAWQGGGNCMYFELDHFELDCEELIGVSANPSRKRHWRREAAYVPQLCHGPGRTQVYEGQQGPNGGLALCRLARHLATFFRPAKRAQRRCHELMHRLRPVVDPRLSRDPGN